MEVEMMVLQDQLAQCASDLEACEEGRLAATRDSENLRGEAKSLRKQLRAALLETGTALAQVAALKESEEAAFHSLKSLRSRNGAGVHSSIQVSSVSGSASTAGIGSSSSVHFKTLLQRRNRSAKHILQRRVVKKLKSLTSRRSLKMMFTAASVRSSKGNDGVSRGSSNIHALSNAFVDCFSEKLEQITARVSDDGADFSGGDSDSNSDDEISDADAELMAAFANGINTAGNKVGQLESNHDAVSRRLRGQIRDAQSQIGKLQAQLRNCTADTDKATNKLQAHQRRLADQTKDIGRLRRQRDGLKKMFDKSQAVVKKTLNECRKLHRQVQNLESREESMTVVKVAASAAAVLGSPTLRPAGLLGHTPPQGALSGHDGHARNNLMMSLASMRGQLQGLADSVLN
jgi:chromosome segregation ATPase